MRMKSSTHHVPIMLTLCGLQRHRRGTRAFCAVEHRESRHACNDVTSQRCIRLAPRIKALTKRFCRGFSRPVPTVLTDIQTGTGSRSPDARYR
jgi:hypothetical protein